MFSFEKFWSPAPRRRTVNGLWRETRSWVRSCTSDRRLGPARRNGKEVDGSGFLTLAAELALKNAFGLQSGASPTTAKLLCHAVPRERACQGELEDLSVQKNGMRRSARRTPHGKCDARFPWSGGGVMTVLVLAPLAGLLARFTPHLLLEALALGGPVHKVLQLLAVFPGKVNKFGRGQIAGFPAKESFKTPAKIGTLPWPQTIAARNNPVVSQRVPHTPRPTNDRKAPPACLPFFFVLRIMRFHKRINRRLADPERKLSRPGCVLARLSAFPSGRAMPRPASTACETYRSPEPKYP